MDRMPQELLATVFNFLPDSSSIHAVRLTCRAFTLAAIPVFATSFNHRVFHCTKRSILNLQDLSRSTLVPYITQLQFSTIGIGPVPLSSLSLELFINLMQQHQDERLFSASHAHGSDMLQALASSLCGLKALAKLIVIDGSAR